MIKYIIYYFLLILKVDEYLRNGIMPINISIIVKVLIIRTYNTHCRNVSIKIVGNKKDNIFLFISMYNLTQILFYSLFSFNIYIPSLKINLLDNKIYFAKLPIFPPLLIM